MMKSVIKTLVLLCGLFASAQSTYKGSLVDENRNAVAFANVILLSLPDSTLIKGAISNEKGIFELSNAEKLSQLALKITHLEYKEKVLPVNSFNFGEISLEKVTNELGEVVVSASKPIMKQQGTAIITDIATSKLKNLPKTEMLLNFLPGVTTSYTGGGYEVFGKGNPVFYINNRKVHNIDEVNRLSPKDIETIELETQPGAEFDNSVGAIIRIKLKKKQGDGFSGSIFADNQFLERGIHNNLGSNLNYRKGKTDIFVEGNFFLSHHQISDSFNEFSVKNTAQSQIFSEEKHINNQKNFYGRLGLNHEFNESHSAGVSLKYRHEPISGRSFAEQKFQIFQNQILTNEILTNYIHDNKDRKYTANAYYEGQISKTIKLQTDVDYIASFSNFKTDISEKNTLTPHENFVHTNSEAHSHWAGFKTTLTQEFGKLRVSYGTEMSHLSREDFYQNSVLNAPQVGNKEIRSSGFASATYPIKKVNVKAGIRYEYADFQYFEDQIKQETKSRLYKNWLPNVSVAFPWGKTLLSWSYQKRIERPYFHQLSGYAQYENLFLYNIGNPYLLPSLTDEMSVLASYKNLSASLVASHHHHAYFKYYQPSLSNPTLIEQTIRNYDDFQSLKLVLSAHHTIGKWTPKLSFTGAKQFADDIFYKNELIYQINLQNNIQLSEKWLLLLYADYFSKGSNHLNYNEKPFGGVHLGFAGNFFNNSLTIFVVAQDVFDTFQMYNNIENQYVQFRSYQDNSGMRCLKFGLQYHFNPTRNKYKGQGNEENRL